MNPNLRQIEVLAPPSRPDGKRKCPRGYPPETYKRGADLKRQVTELEQQRRDHIATIDRLTARLGDGGLARGTAAMEGPVVGRASSSGPPPELAGEVRRLQACIDERDGWIQGWRQQCDTLRLEKETDARAHGAQCRMLSASLATASDSCCTLATQLAKAKEETAAAAIERVALDQRHATQTALCASADEHIRRANTAYVDLQAKHTAARDTVLRLTGQLEQANRPASIHPALATADGFAPATGPLAGPGPVLADAGPADRARPRPDSVPLQSSPRADAALLGPALPGTARPGPVSLGPGIAPSLPRASSPAGVTGALPSRSPSVDPGVASGRHSTSPDRASASSADSRRTPPSPEGSPQSLNRIYHGLSPNLQTSSPDASYRPPSTSPGPVSRPSSESDYDPARPRGGLRAPL